MSLVSLKYAIAICEQLEKICAAKPIISQDDVTGGYIPDESRLYHDESGTHYDVGNLNDLAKQLKTPLQLNIYAIAWKLKLMGH